MTAQWRQFRLSEDTASVNALKDMHIQQGCAAADRRRVKSRTGGRPGPRFSSNLDWGDSLFR